MKELENKCLISHKYIIVEKVNLMFSGRLKDILILIKLLRAVRMFAENLDFNIFRKSGPFIINNR